ncbi:hypothetical protein AYO21_07965 [Fonsecaea monophora]|uniref:TauD/TfdA-like domain-containing protein n=1 Tax=Fonsecaea monophora TaxID=254056 RepID=A0A177F3S6_9EURO|nr:hypothetical protein AYO21_07965 [Fonsecaea monophora]OAG37859.1 hypothetical protein AYO21_07965 [Fonsecaea monophora]
MAHLEARKFVSPDSGFPVTLHPGFNAKIKDWVPPEPLREEIKPEKDRALFADPEKKALFAVAKRVDLTESIGTLLENVQLSQLDEKQLDELALLVTERGVVFFRDQDLTTEGQYKLFEHYGTLDRHPAQKPQGDWHADTSFEINPPSYSLLRMEEHPEVGGDTAWISQYGTYDALSKALQKFVEGLHAVHTSRLQYDTILDLWGVGPNRPPIDTHHPAVRTHPVTGLKALNINPGFVTGFAELNKKESDKLLEFFEYHLHSADDHYVRWKWAVGSVAMWDNRYANHNQVSPLHGLIDPTTDLQSPFATNGRCTAHRVIPGTYDSPRRGIRTTVFGEKPFFDPASESRRERQLRAKQANGQGQNGHSGQNGQNGHNNQNGH